MLSSHLHHLPTSFSALLLPLLLISPVAAQTYSSCNPTRGAQCPAVPALGRSATVNFASGVGSDFTLAGAPTFGGEGGTFTVAKSGDSPTVNSKWYIMFGRVEVTLKSAPGTGIVSSVVLQSDDLDEIDWEFLGGVPDSVQSNFFGKGVAGANDRVAVLPVAGTQTQFHTYSVDWTADRIVWSIDGKTARVLNYAEANGQYPQTPMQVKIGAWAGGDTAANAPGTVQWAGGATNFAAGPFSMVVKSVSVTDYSTGTGYSYTDASGTWQSISAVGGKINSSGGGSSASGGSQSASGTQLSAPAITSTTSGAQPWTGTHRSGDSTTLTTSASSSTASYPGLPSGWTVTSSGKVVPPASASSTPSPSPPSSPSQQPSPSASPPASPSASPSPEPTTLATVTPAAATGTTPSSCAGLQTLHGFDIKGLPTAVLVAPGSGVKYDDRGNIVGAPGCSAASSPAGAGNSQGFIAMQRRAASGAATTLPRSATRVALCAGVAVAVGAALGIGL